MTRTASVLPARTLVHLRDAWLNPPDTPAEDLKKRTLTNLYNQRPTWLDNAHRTLDEAVFAAYGWPSNLTKQHILANLLALNHEHAAAQALSQPPKRADRKPKRSTASTPRPRRKGMASAGPPSPTSDPPS